MMAHHVEAGNGPASVAGPRFQVFGHRGSPGFPRHGENTRRSFRKALDQGAAGVELDVRRCADDTIVVIHDATIERTTNGRGRVSDLSYKQLSQFDAGGGEVIPRLSDILQEFGPRGFLNIELKEASLAQEVAAMVRERNLISTVILSAFNTDDNDADASSSWNELAAVADHVPTALLITARNLQRLGEKTFIETAQQFHAKAIHPQRGAVTPELVALAHKASFALRVWTVNNPSEVADLRDLAVDAIFTDFPGLFSTSWA